MSYKSQLFCNLYTSPRHGRGRAAMDRRFTNRLHLLAPMLRLSVELILNWGRLVGPLNTARGGATTRPNGGGPLGSHRVEAPAWRCAGWSRTSIHTMQHLISLVRSGAAAITDSGATAEDPFLRRMQPDYYCYWY